MRLRITILLGVVALASVVGMASSPPKSVNPSAPVLRSSEDADAMRLEGRANCGRGHAAPHKFPPRMMATIMRHMRVRATITDEDMRLVLYYMTQ